MKRFGTEEEVGAQMDSPAKTAMMALVNIAHRDMDGVVFNAVAEGFYLIEGKDDPQKFELYTGGPSVDLTDFDGMCYEFADLSEDGTVLILFWTTNCGGGPIFYVPSELWVAGGFLHVLAAATGDPLEMTVAKPPTPTLLA